MRTIVFMRFPKKDLRVNISDFLVIDHSYTGYGEEKINGYVIVQYIYLSW